MLGALDIVDMALQPGESIPGVEVYTLPLSLILILLEYGARLGCVSSLIQTT